MEKIIVILLATYSVLAAAAILTLPFLVFYWLLRAAMGW